MTLALRTLKTTDPGFEAELRRLLHWSAETDRDIETRVADILADVQRRGDAAVLEYTARFDGLQAASMAELELKQAEQRFVFTVKDTLPVKLPHGNLLASSILVKNASGVVDASKNSGSVLVPPQGSAAIRSLVTASKATVHGRLALADTLTDWLAR